MHEFKEKLMEEVDKGINGIIEQGIKDENIDILSKLVDIHKDVKNEEYWEKKGEAIEMRYRDYNEYGNRGYGRSNYGRRGRDGRGRYRGEDIMEEMMERYDEYNEASEEMNRGNYGAESGMVKSVEGIMRNIYEIVCELSEADSPEVMRVIKKYSKKIEEMD